MTKPVEDRIVEHYKGEDGNWIVEKGKVTEAKLLKEAVFRIRDIKNTSQYFSAKYRELQNELNEREEAIRIREEKLKRRQTTFKNTMNSVQALVSDYLKGDV